MALPFLHVSWLFTATSFPGFPGLLHACAQQAQPRFLGNSRQALRVNGVDHAAGNHVGGGQRCLVAEWLGEYARRGHIALLNGAEDRVGIGDEGRKTG